MKLKKTTLILAGFALGAMLLVFGLEQSQQKMALETDKIEAGVSLFSFKEADAAMVTVQNTAGETFRFERTEQRFPKTWAMTAPKEVVADEAAIAFLLDQLSNSKSPRRLEVSLGQKKDFGFGALNPSAKIRLKGDHTHEIILGGKTFDGQGRYALVNPPTPRPTTLTVSIVDPGLLDAIERPLAEWEYNPEKFPRPSTQKDSQSAP